MGSITDLLRRSGEGPSADDELYRLIYDGLRRRARYWLRREPGAAGLETTELVHEAYLKIARGRPVDWKDRDHFFGVAARAMRQVLVEMARRRKALKRGGGAAHFPLDEEEVLSESSASEVLAVDDFLRTLPGGVSELDVRIVTLHYFSGLALPDVAAQLGREDGVPRPVEEVERRWEYVRALIYQRLRRPRD